MRWRDRAAPQTLLINSTSDIANQTIGAYAKRLSGGSNLVWLSGHRRISSVDIGCRGAIEGDRYSWPFKNARGTMNWSRARFSDGVLSGSCHTQTPMTKLRSCTQVWSAQQTLFMVKCNDIYDTHPHLDCRGGTDMNALSPSLYSKSSLSIWLTSRRPLRVSTALRLLERMKRRSQSLGIGPRKKNDERSASKSMTGV